MVHAADLVGTWRLVSWETVSPGGVGHPMGRDAVGYLSYDRGGRMSVQVMRRERGELTDDGVVQASADRLRDVLGGYLAYAGGYEVDTAAGTVNPSHRVRPPARPGGHRPDPLDRTRRRPAHAAPDPTSGTRIRHRQPRDLGTRRIMQRRRTASTGRGPAAARPNILMITTDLQHHHPARVTGVLLSNFTQYPHRCCDDARTKP